MADNRQDTKHRSTYHSDNKAGFRGPKGKQSPDRAGTDKNGSRTGKSSAFRPGADQRDSRTGRTPEKRFSGRPYSGEKKTEFRKPYGGRNGERKPFETRDRREIRVVEGLASRRSAYHVISAVTEKGTWASIALDRELKKAGLNTRDRRLAARLAYDTIDRLYYLDHMLSQVMAREDTDIRLRNILRLGACQLLLEDHIPEMAATDTSVELCREIGLDGLAGGCNGILRNLIRKKDELKLPSFDEDPVRAVSVRLSVPEFLVRQLADDYGMDEAQRMLSISGSESALTVRRNLLRTTAESFEKLLSKKVWEVKKGQLPDSWYIMNAANIGEDSDFLSGNFSIQSEQSQMACLACSPRRGSLVIDTCAAPGGKACYLAEMMDGTGRVQAWELHEHRTEIIASQVKRLGLDNVRPMTRDATVFREDLLDAADLVLLDAPCTGTGELHDKPDSKYRLKPESLQELRDLQKILLDTVSRYVKPGGILVYSTCSVLKDENERQVLRFLEEHPQFSIDPLPDTIPEHIRKDYATGVQLMPGVHASGGFFICRMRRKRV